MEFEWVCQLGNGVMLCRNEDEAYERVVTGYPYPDTRYLSRDALVMLFKAELNPSLRQDILDNTKKYMGYLQDRFLELGTNVLPYDKLFEEYIDRRDIGTLLLDDTNERGWVLVEYTSNLDLVRGMCAYEYIFGLDCPPDRLCVLVNKRHPNYNSFGVDTARCVPDREIPNDLYKLALYEFDAVCFNYDSAMYNINQHYLDALLREIRIHAYLELKYDKSISDSCEDYEIFPDMLSKFYFSDLDMTVLDTFVQFKCGEEISADFSIMFNDLFKYDDDTGYMLYTSRRNVKYLLDSDGNFTYKYYRKNEKKQKYVPFYETFLYKKTFIGVEDNQLVFDMHKVCGSNGLCRFAAGAFLDYIGFGNDDMTNILRSGEAVFRGYLNDKVLARELLINKDFTTFMDGTVTCVNEILSCNISYLINYLVADRKGGTGWRAIGRETGIDSETFRIKPFNFLYDRILDGASLADILYTRKDEWVAVALISHLLYCISAYDSYNNDYVADGFANEELLNVGLLNDGYWTVDYDVKGADTEVIVVWKKRVN